MTQITYYAYSKYDLALLFTLLTLIDSRLAELETERSATSATVCPTTTWLSCTARTSR